MTRGGRTKAGHRALAALVAFVAVASACNSRVLRPPATISADGGEYTVTTSVREQGRRFPAVFHAFFPSAVPLHPGDAVNFGLRDTGEPHTVALGRLVDRAVAAVDTLGPTATLQKIEAAPEMRALPAVLPSKLKDDVPEVNPTATERCFLAPGDGFGEPGEPCPQTEQPDFDGKQRFFSSGILEEGEPFRVKLSDDIEPGTYAFMCMYHRSQMTGRIEVVPKTAERPTVAELKLQAEREQEQIDSAIEPSAKATAQDEKEGGPIAAGTGPRGTTRAFLAAFIPDVAKTTVGTPVTWNLYRTHSISFRPSREAKEGLLLDEERPVEVNPDAWKPVKSKPAPKEVFVHPPTKKDGFKIDGGSWDGEGEFSSGVLRSSPPTPVSYTMRFTEPGTYGYTCLVHQSMRGKIEVSEN